MHWNTAIGLEVHVELATNSKIFCNCSTEFGAAPNTQCCPICTGLPGTLPVLNEKVVEYATLAGLALGCEIQPYNRFDRKNYFYPDLPKSYQTSQHYLPLCRGGAVTITPPDGTQKTINLHGIHMEEDTGKRHRCPKKKTDYIDFNRAGIPLIEIITKPEIQTGEDTIAFLGHVKSVLAYLSVSDCQMHESSLRVDVNLSVNPSDSEVLGTRTEMKNLNSFRAIKRAIAHESERQIQVLSSGKKVAQETRRWDDSKNQSFPMRAKEAASDYRYFPDPDIPPLLLDAGFIANLKQNLPEFASARAARFVKTYHLTSEDAALLAESRPTAELFEAVAKEVTDPKEAANWLLGAFLHEASAQGKKPGAQVISKTAFIEFINAITNGKISRTTGKQIFPRLFNGNEDIEAYIQTNNLTQISDAATIQAAVDSVLRTNQKTVADYQAGKTRAFSFLVGETMRTLSGKGNPIHIRKAIEDSISRDYIVL